MVRVINGHATFEITNLARPPPSFRQYIIDEQPVRADRSQREGAGGAAVSGFYVVLLWRLCFCRRLTSFSAKGASDSPCSIENGA